MNLRGNRMEDSESRPARFSSGGSGTSATSNLVESNNSASWTRGIYRRITATANQDTRPNVEASSHSSHGTSRQTRRPYSNNGRTDSQSSKQNYTRSWGRSGNSSKQPDNFTGNQVSHNVTSQSRTNCREAQNGPSHQNGTRQQSPPQYTIMKRDSNTAAPSKQASKNEETLLSNSRDNAAYKERDEVAQDRPSTKRKNKGQQRNRRNRGRKESPWNSQEQSAATQEQQLDGASSTESSSTNNGNDAARCPDAPDRCHSDTTLQNQPILTEKRLPTCKMNKPPFRIVRLKTSEPSTQESNKLEENLTPQNTSLVKESEPITKLLQRNDSLKGKPNSNKLPEKYFPQNPSVTKKSDPTSKPSKRNDSSKDKKEWSTWGDLTSHNSSSVQKKDPITTPSASKKESIKIVPQNPPLARRSGPLSKPWKMIDPPESKNDVLTASYPPLMSIPVSKPEECSTVQTNSVTKPRSKHKETMQFYQPPALRRQESLRSNESTTNNSTDEVSQATQKPSHKPDPIPVADGDTEIVTKLENNTNNADCNRPIPIYPISAENWDEELNTKLKHNPNNAECIVQSNRPVPVYPISTEDWDSEIVAKLENVTNVDCNIQSNGPVSTYPISAENWDEEIDTKLKNSTINNVEYNVPIPVDTMEVEFVGKQESGANNNARSLESTSRKSKGKRYSQRRRRDRHHSKEEPQREEANSSTETTAVKYDSMPHQTHSYDPIKSEEAMPNFEGSRRPRHRNDRSDHATTESQNQLPMNNVAEHDSNIVHSELIQRLVKSLEDDVKYTIVEEQTSLQNAELQERLCNNVSMVNNFLEVSQIEGRESRQINEQFSCCLQNVEQQERLHSNNIYPEVSYIKAQEKLKFCTPPPGFSQAPQNTKYSSPPPGFPSVSKRREHENFSEPPPGFPKVPKCSETDATHKTDHILTTKPSYSHTESGTKMHPRNRDRKLDFHDSQVKANNQEVSWDYRNDVAATRLNESVINTTEVESEECIDYWDLTTVAEPVNKTNPVPQVDTSDSQESFDYWDFSGTKKVGSRATKSTLVQKETVNAPSEMAFLTEVNGDLFAAPNASSLVHCVAEDLRMSSGIAVDFRQKFGRLPELLNQRCKTGELAVLPEPKDSPARYIYYLVTKPKSTDKPTIHTLESSLQCLREHCDMKNVTQLAMPRIGCGLDLLKWSQVTELLRKIFSGSGISIVVYSLDKLKEDTDDQSIKYFSIKESLNCQLSEMESGTARVFLASEGPMADSTMQDLNVKYRFLSTYETARRSKGDIFRYECKFPHEVLYGLVARSRSIYEPVDFLALDAALRALRKDIKKDNYSYIGIEAYYEENDPMIVEKLVTAIKWVFVKTNVQLHVCWPKTVMMQYGITAN